MKRIVITLATSAALLGALFLTASALTTTPTPSPRPSKMVAQCLKTATSKQTAALKAANDTYTDAVKKATGRNGKTVRAKALSDYKAAQNSAKNVFAADRRACTATAPKY